MSVLASILIVEDEPKIAALLQDYLRAAGYQCDWLATGVGVPDHVRATSPALILLDLMLPGGDGVEICRQIRSFSTVPVIMLTARIEEIDRLLGLDAGADDYVCKPFSPREVVARVNAQLRRAAFARGHGGEGTGAVGAEAGPLVLDAERFTATWHRQPLNLTPVEFRLLQVFAAQPGRVYSRAQLMDAAYRDHRVVEDRTVDSHVKNLRRKLMEVTPGNDPIRSVYGVGYRFEPEAG